MYQLTFYVVESYLETVKNALFAAGAGAYGKFKNCCWETLGYGQYQLNEPFSSDGLVRQPEYKVEILCKVQCLEQVIESLKKNHPCNEPAFYLTKVERDIGVE